MESEPKKSHSPLITLRGPLKSRATKLSAWTGTHIEFITINANHWWYLTEETVRTMFGEKRKRGEEGIDRTFRLQTLAVDRRNTIVVVAYLSSDTQWRRSRWNGTDVARTLLQMIAQTRETKQVDCKHGLEAGTVDQRYMMVVAVRLCRNAQRRLPIEARLMYCRLHRCW